MNTNRRRQAIVEQEGVDDFRAVDIRRMRVYNIGLLLYTPH